MRSRASTRATCPATAVFPTRFPRPITASEGVPTGSSGGGSKRKSAPRYGSPSASARESPEHPLPRPEHRLVGEVEHEICLDRVERVDERDAIVVVTAQLLRPAHEQRADDVVRERLERIPHYRRVVLAVDQDERPLAHVERTSSSIFAVYFSYVFVSVENWMIFSCPWNG